MIFEKCIWVRIILTIFFSLLWVNTSRSYIHRSKLHFHYRLYEHFLKHTENRREPWIRVYIISLAKNYCFRVYIVNLWYLRKWKMFLLLLSSNQTHQVRIQLAIHGLLRVMLLALRAHSCESTRHFHSHLINIELHFVHFIRSSLFRFKKHILHACRIKTITNSPSWRWFQYFHCVVNLEN